MIMMEKRIVTVENAKELTGLHFTTKHTGKMTGMQSLSTSCVCNPYCQERSMNGDTICSHCYAQRQMKMYKNLEKCLQNNTEILTKRLLKDDEIPYINAAYFRFESFGDLNNELQVMNYFKICRKNPHVRFALWTKNPWFIRNVLKEEKKPRNIQIILSSVFLNQRTSAWSYDFIDKVFTVYDKKFAEENGITINCGAKSCLKCHKCYVKGTTRYINEVLK